MKMRDRLKAGLIYWAICFAFHGGVAAVEPVAIQVRKVEANGQVRVLSQGRELELRPGERSGNWTLMAVCRDGARRRVAVFEDFTEFKGELLIAGERGEGMRFPKSLEPTWAEAGSLYRGHRLEEVLGSERDLLGEELLAGTADPNYAEVASCFPPLTKMYTYSFVGTRETLEKVGVFYGGATPNFDPAAYVPAIGKIREKGRVLDGLVGGWLPVLRFVYPEAADAWSELILYAPRRIENGNDHVQPVWYRLCRIEGGVLRWVRYFDSYHPFPPRMEAGAQQFYEELLALRTGWDEVLASSMRLDIPDQKLADMARHSLVREMITRVRGFPKYGVFDRGYGGSEHDGFPDTLTTAATVLIEWGLSDVAREDIENYLKFFLRDDGSILYRGPETGQFGRMLTLVAEYWRYTGDDQLLLRYRGRLDAVTKLLMSLRGKSLALASGDVAHGIIAGWSEADACLDPEPSRYMQPYFSNNTEAARGFQDLAEAWERMGSHAGRAELLAWGRQMQAEARALASDTQRAIERSIFTNTEPPCLPAIAGVKEPFHVAVGRDKLDPQFRSYRAFGEMLYSGNLTARQAAMILNYRKAHHDVILGIPTAYGYNTHEWAGFLAYGHAYGLLQMDSVREYLLTLYSLIANQYSRGVWTAPETRRIEPNQFAAPYCVPAQMMVPMLLRWMLVWEEPGSEMLWLGKAVPRDWLGEGQHFSVSHAPTRWGRINFEVQSRMDRGIVEARLELPRRPPGSRIKLRLRAPEHRSIKEVVVNGRKWDQFDSKEETIGFGSEPVGSVRVEVRY